MKKITVILGSLLLVAVLFSGCGQKDPNKVVIGIDNNPPYTFVESYAMNFAGDGEKMPTETITYIGYDIDVMAAVAKKAGLTVEYQQIPFSRLLPLIEKGNIDLAIGGISITPEREKSVGFTKSYVEGGVCLIGFKGDTFGINDLAGKNVGAEIGTTLIEAAKTIPGASVKGYYSTQEMLIDLLIGKLDAVVMDKLSSEYYIKDKGITRLQVVDNMKQEKFGFAMKKDNKELADKLNKAFEELEKSGELKQIYDKWFAK